MKTTILASLFAWTAAAASAAASAADLGTVGPFALTDVDGKPRTAAEWSRAKAVVYCVLGTECPVSNGYAAQMQRLADKYAAEGVAFVGAYAEPDVTAEEAKQHGQEYGLKFARLLDPEHKLIGLTGARRMPTFVVARPDGRIAYRGRIDDRWSPEGKRRDTPRTHELEDAIEAVLAGREPPVAETPTFGCPLPRAAQR